MTPSACWPQVPSTWASRRNPEAIHGRWVRNQKWILKTWDQIWKEYRGLAKYLLKKDGDEEISSESSSDDEEVEFLSRRVKELEDAIRILQPYKELDLLDNVWDEDKVFKDMEEAPLSDRLAVRRKGGKSLFQKVGKTTNALPEDKGECRR